MATATSAYRNSPETQSPKKRDFLTRSDIAELLDAADFSREMDATIIRRAGREKGRRTYRRRHLVAALKGIWRASTSPYSASGEILCFASVEGYAIEAGVSERALRYNLRELEKIGVLQMVYAANTVRRPATYRLNLSVLRRRPTYDEIKKSRPPRRALHSIHHHHSSPTAREAAPAAISAAPVPVPLPVQDPERESRRQARRLTPREGPKLVAKMAELMRGTTRLAQLDGVGFNLQPDDPRYRAPMSQENAIIAACMTLGIAEADAREHLKLCCWKFEGAEKSP